MALAPPDPAPESGAALADPLDPLLGYQLRRASAVVLADLTRALADLALRPADASVLLLIAANPDITQSRLGRTLGIQRANMAPLTAALIDRGLVDRARADGRSHALRLSAAGAALAEVARGRIAAHEARLMPAMAAPERAALTAVLRAIWQR